MSKRTETKRTDRVEQMEGNDYADLFDLTGKVAMVTGGLGILGRHFCAGLAHWGADVVVARPGR